MRIKKSINEKISIKFDEEINRKVLTQCDKNKSFIVIEKWDRHESNNSSHLYSDISEIVSFMQDR